MAAGAGRIALYAKVHQRDHRQAVGFVEVCTRWLSPDPADKVARAISEGLPAHDDHAAARPAPDAVTSLVRRVVERRDRGGVAVLVAGQAGEGLGGTRLRNAVAVLRDPDHAAGAAVGTAEFCLLRVAAGRGEGLAQGARWPTSTTWRDGGGHRAQPLPNGQRRGAADQPLVADMPVALPSTGRGSNDHRRRARSAGAAHADPMVRLRTICRHTAEVERHVKAGLADALVAVHDDGGPWNSGAVRAARDRTCTMLANLIISNPFGLPERRYLAEGEVEIALPISLLAAGQSLNVTRCSMPKGCRSRFSDGGGAAEPAAARRPDGQGVRRSARGRGLPHVLPFGDRDTGGGARPGTAATEGIAAS